MGRDEKRGGKAIKRENEKFLIGKIIKKFDLEKHYFYNKWLYHLCTMFHVNIEIMNNDRYVFIASNHQYENKCLLYCSYDDFIATIS